MPPRKGTGGRSPKKKATTPKKSTTPKKATTPKKGAAKKGKGKAPIGITQEHWDVLYGGGRPAFPLRCAISGVRITDGIEIWEGSYEGVPVALKAMPVRNNLLSLYIYEWHNHHLCRLR